MSTILVVFVLSVIAPLAEAQDSRGRSNGGSIAVADENEPKLEIWYGNHQRFGHLGGHPQRWINILGSVKPSEQVGSLKYRLNETAGGPLSFREDKKRIASDGDFNVEIHRDELRAGKNVLQITAQLTSGTLLQSEVVIDYVANAKKWPLPYSVDWSKVKRIGDAVQVVDGKWELSTEGIRSRQRYYDRDVAFGDATWRDYEVRTTVKIHALTGPKEGPNTTGVTHAAIALRWPGHDPDGKQPSVKWHPLGATAEFRLGKDLSQCRWRIFDGQRKFYVESGKRRKIDFEQLYNMKHRVQTLADGRSHYQVKLWHVNAPESDSWDCERFEPGTDLQEGSTLLLAHHSDVTFGNISVVPIPPLPTEDN